MEDPEKKWTPLWTALLRPVFVLLIGWVAKQYL
jgi:hypothetical protein